MAMGPGVVGPSGFPIRDVKKRPQSVGRIWNNAGKWEIGATPATLPGPGAFKVERPTNVKSTKSTSRGTGEG